MNMPDIEAFVALAETGSVNRAARRLNLTQPAVTRRIQSFEAAMDGAVLLDRRAKPSVLTPEGRRALEGCRKVLKAVSELRLTTSAGQPSGEFRLGIANGLAEMALSAPIDALRQRFPAVRPRVTAHWTTWLIEQVRNGGLDCAVGIITSDHAVPSGLHSTAICLERVVVVAARDAPIVRPIKGNFAVRDLAGSEWILNPHGCGYRAAIQRAFDLSDIPLRIAAEVFGHDLQLSLVSRGAGLSLVPRRQLDNSRYRRGLRVLKLDDFDLQATISMLHGSSLGRFVPVVDYFQSQVSEAFSP